MIFWYSTIRAMAGYRAFLIGNRIKDDGLKFLFRFPAVQITGTFFGYENKIISPGKTRLVKSEKFSQQSLRSVPCNRVSDLPADCNPYPCIVKSVFPGDYDEVRRVVTFPRPI